MNIMSVKNSIMIFSILFAMSCHSEKESSTDSKTANILSEKEPSKESKYLRWVDDIAFDPAVDDNAFKVCHGDDQIIQYFNNSQGVEYGGEKPAIDKAFQENYDASKAAK